MASQGSSAAPPYAAVQRSPWHSPVPYLFGGLAAMLGLIAFALLILACSYWKLYGYLENGGDGDSAATDLEAGEGGGDDGKPAPPVMEEKFLVIMAGQEKPTFLATPASSRTSSFGSTSTSSSDNSKTSGLPEEECEEKKMENGRRIEAGNEEAEDQVR